MDAGEPLEGEYAAAFVAAKRSRNERLLEEGVVAASEEGVVAAGVPVAATGVEGAGEVDAPGFDTGVAVRAVQTTHSAFVGT